MRSHLKTRGRKGQGIAEYGMILVLVPLICFLGLTSMGESNDQFYRDLSGTVDEVTAGQVGGTGSGEVLGGGNSDVF